MKIQHNAKQRQPRRPGAAAIEFAFVFPIVFAIFFSFVEHGRYAMIKSLVQNACREGARYAAVTITDPNIDETEIIDWVDDRMMGYQNSLAGYNVQVFLTNPNGDNLGDYENALYSQMVAVQITGTHEVWLPIVTMLPPTLEINMRAVCMAEAN
jgi:Flp pilus assembly protein TadG